MPPECHEGWLAGLGHFLFIVGCWEFGKLAWRGLLRILPDSR